MPGRALNVSDLIRVEIVIAQQFRLHFRTCNCYCLYAIMRARLMPGFEAAVPVEEA